MDALVTDVQHRAAVAGVRALGRSGIRVVAVGTRQSAAGLWSRYAADRAPVTAPGTPDGGFVAALDRLAAERPFVVYPASEDAVEALLRAWPELPESAVMPFPGPEVLRAIRDKRRLPAFAAEAGLRAPTTLAQAPASELASFSPQAPVIAKPSSPAGGFHGAKVVESSEQLLAWARQRRFPPGEPLLVQERAEGPLLSVELVLARDGTVVTRFQQRSKRTWPVAAGSISFATSVAPDEELIERVARMLSGAGYWGLVQLDVVASQDGPVIVDVNPRFYSCLPLALACGVNLPAAWHAVATSEPPPPTTPYRPGVSFRWLEGDLVAAASGHPRRLLQRAPKPRAGSMWAADDPWASVLLGAGIVTTRLGRLLGRERP